MRTPLVVFDTSVLFSYVFKPGRPYFLLASLRSGRLIAVSCGSILSELRDVSLRHVQVAQLEGFTSEFLRLAEVLPDPAKHFVHQTDPKDSVFFDLAIETRADYLVTYDEAHILAVGDPANAQHAALMQLAPNLKIEKPFELARALASSGEASR
jgi:putative PIN family toxin of toxin-antitoxin system